MLLSDRDILAEIDAQRVALEPFDEEMVQPSSIDGRRAPPVFNSPSPSRRCAPKP